MEAVYPYSYNQEETFKVSRRILFRWQNALDTHESRIDALDPKSRAPKRRRERQYPSVLLKKIVQLRTDHPRIGKKKLAPILNGYGYNVSESYVGRTLVYMKAQGILPSCTRLSLHAGTGKLHEKVYTPRKKA